MDGGRGQGRGMARELSAGGSCILNSQPGPSIPTAHRAPVAAFTAAAAGPPLSPAGKSPGLTGELSKVRPFFDSW